MSGGPLRSRRARPLAFACPAPPGRLNRPVGLGILAVSRLPPDAPRTRVELTGAVHDWAAGWDACRRSPPAWAACVPPGGPIYRLPVRAIETLSLPRNSSPPVLDDPAAAA